VRRLAEVIEPRFSALIWTAAASGLRFGELTGLTRRHVDLDAATLQVEQALTTERGKGAVVGAPKSIAAYRVVAIPETAVEMLRAHIDRYTGDDADSFIFTSVKGRLLLNQYFATYWKRALATAEVDKATRFHDSAPSRRHHRCERRSVAQGDHGPYGSCLVRCIAAIPQSLRTARRGDRRRH